MYGLDMEAKFRVGDKVRVIKGGDDLGGSCHAADIGEGDTIIADADDYGRFEGEQWFYNADEIELVAAEVPAPKYKVGRRVRVVDSDGGGKVGDVATVTQVDFLGGDDSYIYTLDGLSDGAVMLYESRLAPAFLPGDKVRVTKHSGYFAFGDVGEVERQAADVVFVKHGSYQRIGLPIDAGALELVEAAQPGLPGLPAPKFKVGDKVTTTGADGGPGFGTVLNDNGDGSYQVKFPQPYNECREPVEWLSLAAPGSVSSPCIVARVVDGTPRPSNIPYVHASVQAATTEAERLATNNPGQEFAVYQRVAGRVAEVSYSMKEVA